MYPYKANICNNMTLHNNTYKGFNSLRFRDAYDKLSKKDKVELQDTICALIGWSVTTFWTRANGVHPVKESEVPVIEEVFARYNIDPWKGSEIV